MLRINPPGAVGNSPKRHNDKDRTIFCGNLPYSCTEDDLRSLFTEDGSSVERVHMLPKGGAGFIAFGSVEEATKALQWHDSQYQGRKLRINMANDKPAPRQ